MSYLESSLLDNKTLRSKSALSKTIKPDENLDKSRENALTNKRSGNAKSTKTLPEPTPQPADTSARAGAKSAIKLKK